MAIRGRGRPGAKPAISVSTDSGRGGEAAIWPAPPGRSPQASACEPYREAIEVGLSRRRNAMAIWQDLVDGHGFKVGYASVRRFVRKLRGETTPEIRAVIVTAPGEEAQVDYGDGPMVRHPESGKYRRTRLFVLTLGYSRKSVRLLTFRSSSRIWAELHQIAFRRLGGVPRLIILDNLAEGVLEPDVYDPTINPLYRDCLAHYGVVALPCRVGDPDRKGKVESGVGHAQRTPLRGLRFESLDEGQAHLDHWEARWADTRIHGTTKRQVAAMFAEEKPALLALPVEPFRFYEYGIRTVHLDGHVEVAGAYYSVPPGPPGRRVWVQWDELWVRILSSNGGQLLREHLRERAGRYRTKDEDRPAHASKGTEALLLGAQRAGKHIGILARTIYAREKESGIRRIQGVLALARKYGAPSVDDAAAAALELCVPTYRFVRRYLERHPPAPISLTAIDPLIRSLSDYRDRVNELTREGQDR
jgi:transposase